MGLKTKLAFQFTMKDMAKASSMKDLFMWTFTFAEVLPIEEAKKRWGNFVKNRTRGLTNSYPSMSGIRVFEMHPGGRDGLSHGLHIHLVTDTFLPVDVMRIMWHHFAGAKSRLHVKPISKDSAHYIGKYLSKDRVEALKGTRLWQAIGHCDKTCVRDIVVQSEFTDAYKFLNVAMRGFAQLTWGTKIMLCTRFCNGYSIESACQAAGMQNDYWEQVKAEQEHFRNLAGGPDDEDFVPDDDEDSE